MAVFQKPSKSHVFPWFHPNAYPTLASQISLLIYSFYLTTPSVSQLKYHRMIRCLMNNKLKRKWMGEILHNFWSCSGIGLDGLRNTMNLSRPRIVSWSSPTKSVRLGTSDYLKITTKHINHTVPPISTVRIVFSNICDLCSFLKAKDHVSYLQEVHSNIICTFCVLIYAFRNNRIRTNVNILIQDLRFPW
jgi:hypothetical protein